MKTLLIISALSTISFLIFVWKKYGIQKSISASVHVLQGAFEKSLYTWFIVFICLPFMIVSNCTLGWIAGALLWIDAAAVSIAKKDNPIQYYLHNIGAMGGISVAMLMLIVNFGRIDLVAIYTLYLIYNYRNDCKNVTWWNEVAAFVITFIGLI